MSVLWQRRDARAAASPPAGQVPILPLACVFADRGPGGASMHSPCRRLLTAWCALPCAMHDRFRRCNATGLASQRHADLCSYCLAHSQGVCLQGYFPAGGAGALVALIYVVAINSYR